MKTKNLSAERLVFFSDAVVAIAITLLALELKVEKIAGEHITFESIFAEWRIFLAFLLSFFLIALFWINHHKFFQVIDDIDEKLIWINMGWLFFIVLIPFATSLISSDFGQKTSVLTYSTIILGVTFFQNSILDYATGRPGFLPKGSKPLVHDLRGDKKSLVADQQIYCNASLINSLIAVTVSFFSPNIAFAILFTRPLTYQILKWFLNRKVKER